MVQSYKSGRAKVCLNISGLHTKLLYNVKQSFLRCFRDPILELKIGSLESEKIIIGRLE